MRLFDYFKEIYSRQQTRLLRLAETLCQFIFRTQRLPHICMIEKEKVKK